jgi:xylulokinase
MKRFFLGLDSSTQSLKATLIGEDLATAGEVAVAFDTDLPAFKTRGGVHKSADGLTVTSPPALWVAALDMLFDRMQAAGWPLADVAAIAGSGQQHGSVWLKRGARQTLQGLDPRKTLTEQLSGGFSLAGSPIWMDSSTTKQCRALEAALGGPQAVATLTGSRAYERFTGNQIAKIFQVNPDVYAATERIALVSSFVASVLIGDYSPIDASDGSGMNLMDLRRKDWAPDALAATAPGLAALLGPVVASHETVGTIHSFFAKRYGFSPQCAVVASSGDNPCSLAGLRLQETGDVAVSLGTSDTMFGSLAEPKPSADEGHIFVNPVEPAAYMAMVCFKNGSLTRESVRDQAAGGSWPEFDRLLQSSPAGNVGQIGFYIKEPEITPPILKTGFHRFSGSNQRVGAFDPKHDVRAVVEGQFLSMRLHGGNIGIRPRSILATGGASANQGILRILSNVFGVPVFVGDQPNSSSLGAAYRALHGFRCRQEKKFVRFAEVMAGAPPFRKAFDPDPAAHAVYTDLLGRYGTLEKEVLKG